MPTTARAGGAPDPTAEFFENLATRGREPLIADASGTVRIDLTHEGQVEHWYVVMDRGAISVSHKRGRADAVIRTDRRLFDDLATGRTNATAATLRGALATEGELELMIAFQGLFPGPPRSSSSRRTRAGR
jgi:putative sterol carrier protein